MFRSHFCYVVRMRDHDIARVTINEIRRHSFTGVPAGLAEHTITLSYNDIVSLRTVFGEIGGQIACVIVEPIAGNMNMVPPVDGFHDTLRELCTASGTVLIFDEVMTGFRVAKGGAQSIFDITPDLTTLGKIVGGGMPAAAFGGRADIMASLAPDGPVYQAGTLSGNPVAMAAGLATLELIDEPGFYEARIQFNRFFKLGNRVIECTAFAIETTQRNMRICPGRPDRCGFFEMLARFIEQISLLIDTTDTILQVS